MWVCVCVYIESINIILKIANVLDIYHSADHRNSTIECYYDCCFEKKLFGHQTQFFSQTITDVTM